MQSDLVARTRESFDLGAQDISIAPGQRGARGEVWRLTAGGHVYALEHVFAGAPPSRGQVDGEVALARRAAAEGVRLPASHSARNGQYVVPLTTGGWLRLYDWVELHSADLATRRGGAPGSPRPPAPMCSTSGPGAGRRTTRPVVRGPAGRRRVGTAGDCGHGGRRSLGCTPGSRRGRPARSARHPLAGRPGQDAAVPPRPASGERARRRRGRAGGRGLGGRRARGPRPGAGPHPAGLLPRRGTGPRLDATGTPVLPRRRRTGATAARQPTSPC